MRRILLLVTIVGILVVMAMSIGQSYVASTAYVKNVTSIEAEEYAVEVMMISPEERMVVHRADTLAWGINYAGTPPSEANLCLSEVNNGEVDLEKIGRAAPGDIFKAHFCSASASSSWAKMVTGTILL